MAITTGANNGLKSINAYYKAAMMLPVEQLQAIVRGTDKGSAVRIPATIAMMALEAKMPQVTAAQGQQATQQPQQPSVRDQMEGKMAMLPEDVGVGALPAQNMESMGMAEGGIVAFDDGGKVPGYADGILVGQGLNRTPLFTAPNNNYNTRVSNRMSELSQQGGPVLEGVFLENQIASMEAALKTTPPGEQRALIERNLAQLRKQVADNKAATATATAPAPAPAPATAKNTTLEQFQAPPPVEKEAGWAVKGTKPGRRVVDKKGNVKFVPGELSRVPAPIDETAGYAGEVYTPRPLPDNSPYLDPNTYQNVGGPFNLKTEAGRNAAANQRRGVVTQNNKDVPTTETKRDGTPPSAATPSDLKSLIKDVSDASGANKIAEGYTGIESLIEKQNKDEIARYKERPQYEPYKKYEESLKSEEAKVRDKKNQNFQMALVNAGLAIMSGSSRYALQNIGQGAMVGTKQYNEGIKDLEAAAKERQKAFAMIEEARNAKSEKDFDRYDTMMNRQSERAIKAKELGVEGLAKVLNITVPQATNIYTTLKTNASREAIAAANDQVQREKIAADERGELLQYKVGMAGVGATNDYRNAMLEQNMIQKRLTAEQRGQTEYDNFMKTPQGNALSIKSMTDPATAKYLNELRNYFKQEAYTGVGLTYAPIKNPSDSGFKVLGPVK